MFVNMENIGEAAGECTFEIIEISIFIYYLEYRDCEVHVITRHV